MIRVLRATDDGMGNCGGKPTAPAKGSDAEPYWMGGEAACVAAADCEEEAARPP